ncbi:hypothetical protein LTR65_005839 [Meristemomyces frigidus]
MCQYRYYCYATCRHQQTVLSNFCDKATPLPAVDKDKGAGAPALEAPTQAHTEAFKKPRVQPWRNNKASKKNKAAKAKKAQLPQGKSTAAAAAASSPRREPSRPYLPRVNQHSPSSPSIGSASITEEPDLHASSSSLPQQNPTQQHPPPAVAADDMAGLRPFGQTFRHWIGSGPVPQASLNTDYSGIHYEDAAFAAPAAPARCREPGIRQHSDESFDMPDSSDILQHVAESCRDVQGHHMGTDLHRSLSYDSTAADNTHCHNGHAASDSYEAIEADLNRLKEEVVKLKRDGSREGSASGVEEESAAARLQKAHDRLKDTVSTTGPVQLELPVPPRPMDFPALGSGKPVKSISSKATGVTLAPTQAERKLSYASAATVGMKDAIHKAISTSRAKRADSKVHDTMSDVPLSAAYIHSLMRHAATLVDSHTSSSAVARRSFECDDEDSSVIVSPQSVKTDVSEPIVVSKSTPSSPNGHAIKDKPRFAEPTQSFARRAGDALHKDSASTASKLAAGDASLTKRMNKRKSLPGDWLGAKSSQNAHATANPVSSPSVDSSPASIEGWQLVNKVVARETSVATKTSEPQLRKKNSSYMSPTAATTQRTIATLGEENAKRKPGTLRVNTFQANQYTSLSSPDSNALSSAGSLPNSVMERSDFGSSVSPPSPRRQTQRTIDAILAKSSVPLSPREVRHAGAAKKNSESPKSPSKIPRARKTLASHLQELSATSSKDAGRAVSSSPLDAVANTTTRRRTSHADILKPIFDKLDSQGLLRGSADPLHVNHDDRANESRVSSRNDVQRPIRNLIDEAPLKPSPGLEDIALLARQGVGIKKKTIMPPHLRASRQSSAASNGTEAAPAVHAPPQPSEIPAPAPQPLGPQSVEIRYGDVFGMYQAAADAQQPAALTHNPSPASALRAAFGSDQAPGVSQVQPDFLPRPSPASSLRATAPNFTPLWQPQSPVHELSLLSWQGTLDHRPDEEWSPLPGAVKDSIQTLRDFKANGQVPGRTVPSRSQSPSKRQEQRFWGSLMAQSGLTGATAAAEGAHASALSDRDGNVAMSNVGAELSLHKDAEAKGKTTSPNGVRVGQVLKAALSPGKKSVKWTLQETDGQEKPVTFGRAPPPFAPVSDDIMTGDTPLVSPTSDDTSPLKSPHSAPSPHAWTIGSGDGGFAPGYYGWKGGDGKEISFTGYGPNAERDPNSPVNMQFFNNCRAGHFGASPPRADLCSPGSSGENVSPSPKVWPQSRRQWAELAGYSKVPCGSMEIMDAVEQIPLASPTFGYCHDCVPGPY